MKALVVAAIGLSVVLGLAGNAGAERVVLRDNQGRPITFDVRAPDVDVEWYARLLRRAAHGDEISGVTIRIVSSEELARSCGRFAGGCYRGGDGRGTLVVPAGAGSPVAHTLLHEYGHHLDYATGVDGVREPNGTPGWWEVRGMSRLLEEERVAFNYSLGWERSIGEIFAEDYAQLHLRFPYRIGWLSPPGRTIRDAVRSDLPGVPAAPSNPPPLVLVRSGTLQPGQERTLPFGLLGPGRRVTFTVRTGPEARAQLELRCDNGRTVTETLSPTRRSITIDRRNLGPASCRVTLRSTGEAAYRYTIRLRLAVEAV